MGIGNGADLAESLFLRQSGGELHLLPITTSLRTHMRDNLLGDGLVDEIIETGASDLLEHHLDVAVSGSNMSVDELQ